ncbi:MAG: MATE family efflux transporter [Bacteroidales bacterium]|nr:MATE family efflux transporter [Bacteroidales bacterium]
MTSWNKEILRLAIPSIITNITVPLLGMVDLAIAGHVGDASMIGGMALGTMIFNLIYWNFGFLRMGTSGFTAQAFGAEDRQECLNILTRGMTIAFSAALLLILFQWPIALAAKKLINSSETTISLALTYFYVRIWAAPATLGLYAIKGWFIGMQNSKDPMIIAIALNIVHVIFSLLFALYFKMGIAGIALGTVVAQYSGLLMATFVFLKKYRKIGHIDLKESLKWEKMARFFKVNGDLFVGSLCLMAVLTFIPAVSAEMGDLILAANTMLMQLFTLFSYFMDGFAYAGEALVGRCIGANDRKSLEKCVKLLTQWGLGMSALFTLLYLFGGHWIMNLLTNSKDVIAVAMRFMKWSILIPFAGFAAFLFDGIYVGATASRPMRNVKFVATGAFFICYYCLKPLFSNAEFIQNNGLWVNDGLWIAFLLFLIVRGGLMWMFSGKVLKYQ